jgi:hypothetical protein
MSIVDIRKEVELAIKTIVLNSYTRFIYFRADKLKKANPQLRSVYTSHIGKIMNQVLHEYHGKGLIKILGIKRNHVTKFYVKVLKPYFDYAKKLVKEEAIA